MILSELKNILLNITEIVFELESGEKVPSHFHITELGIITRNFIDCGGKKRQELKINLQLWSAQDYNHKLSANKILEPEKSNVNLSCLPNSGCC